MNKYDLKRFDDTVTEADFIMPVNPCFTKSRDQVNNTATMEGRPTITDEGRPVITQTGSLSKQIRIVDKDTGFPLENTHIINQSTGYATITNSQGYATVLANTPNDMFTLSHVAYGKTNMTYENLNSQINLEPEYMTQDPVVITVKPPTSPIDSDKNFAWVKWLAIAAGAFALLAALSSPEEKEKPKKVTV